MVKKVDTTSKATACENTQHRCLKQLVAGGVAGFTAKTAVAPLDRVNILLQGHHQHFKHSGVLDAASKIIHHEGWKGLFRGHVASVTRIVPYASVQFATYELAKKHIEDIFGHHASTKFLAGSCAGLVAVAITYPLDSLRTVIAFQPTGAATYNGIMQSLYTISSQGGGIHMLYKGFTPTLLGIVPYAGVSFCGFETLKKWSLRYYPMYMGRRCPKDGSLVLKLHAKLFCGAMAAVFASITSCPLSVIRRKMQLSVVVENSSNFRSIVTTAQHIYKKRGMRGFYRGVNANIFKIAPMVAISFCVYEQMRELLELDPYNENS